MRPIDADALLKTVPDPRELDERISRNAAIRDMMEIVLTAPTIPATPRWIPAEERLPDVAGRPVLVCTLDRYATWHAIIASITQRGWWDGRIWRRTEGTYWMPLPEPPEEAAP